MVRQDAAQLRGRRGVHAFHLRVEGGSDYSPESVDRSGLGFVDGQERHWWVSSMLAGILGQTTSLTGTDATIAQHIQTIIDRKYVMERTQGATKYLVPSTLGIGLVEGYNDIGFDRSLSRPEMRREVSTSIIKHARGVDELVVRLRCIWSRFVKARARKTRCSRRTSRCTKKCACVLSNR